jgi:hypothetical protein
MSLGDFLTDSGTSPKSPQSSPTTRMHTSRRIRAGLRKKIDQALTPSQVSEEVLGPMKSRKLTVSHMN